MQAGQFDRKIVIQQPTKAKDSVGGDTVVWNAYKRQFYNAQALPMMGKERFAADQIHAAETYRFRIRYIPGVIETFRVLYEGRAYRITGISQIARRMYLEITAEYLQQGGESVG